MRPPPSVLARLLQDCSATALHLGRDFLKRRSALKKWLEFKNTPPEKMKILLEYGQKVAEGEGVE
jgi:hypothetical protein